MSPLAPLQSYSKGAGSFRPAAGTRYLHRECSFAESVAETAGKSLRHSCRSELTRQGISLGCSTRFPEQPDFTLTIERGARGPERQVSEDSRAGSAGLSCGLSPCPPDFDCRSWRHGEYRSAVKEEFPAYGSVLLRLAKVR